MSKVSFFYANGTSYLWKGIFEFGFSIDIGSTFYIGDKPLNPSSEVLRVTAGLNGRTAVWNGAPKNDPFPQLLDPEIWDAHRIAYPASTFPMDLSISQGITNTINAIKKLPPGTPFCLGGYSQGAAVMSGVYNEIRSGSLTSRQSSFLGGVCFGNPRRQVNYRGSRGGTWSGAWDVANSTTGGHGSFPASGPYARLTNCDPLKWIELTAPNDIFSSTGDSQTGSRWVDANNSFLGLFKADVLGYFLNGSVGDIISAAGTAMGVGNAPINLVDAAGTAFTMGGNGHVTYPFLPPEGNPENGLTGFQIAIDFLNKKALEWATASIAISETSAGWSTTLKPPSS